MDNRTSHQSRRKLVAAIMATAMLLGCTEASPDAPVDLGASPDERSPATTASTVSPTTTSTTTPYGDGWSTVHADGANTDYSHVVGASDVERAWERRFEGNTRIGDLEWTINLGPTSDAGGRLFLTTTVPGCHLQAIDTATGETIWCAEHVAQPAVISSPLLDRDGRVFVADGVAMRAFDRDGTEQWQQPIVGVPLSAQFSPAGHVVFVTHVGVVYLLDRSTGANVIDPVELVPEASWSASQPLWACARGTEGCPSANTPAVDLDTAMLYFTWWEPGAAQAGVRAMRIDDGPDGGIVDVWTNDTLPGGSGASPVISFDGSRLYVTDNVDSIHALDAATGALIWSYPIGIAAGGSLSLSPSGLIMAPGGALQAIRDEGDHAALVWRDDTLQNRGIATQAAGDRVYATVVRAPGELDLVVIDSTTGAVLDREPIEGATRFSVGITVAPDGTVLVPTIVGALVAFRPVE